MRREVLLLAVALFLVQPVLATHEASSTPNETSDYLDYVTLKGRFDTTVRDNGSVKLQVKLRNLRRKQIQHLNDQALQGGYSGIIDFLESEHDVEARLEKSNIPSFFRNYDYRIYTYLSRQELEDMNIVNVTENSGSFEFEQKIVLSRNDNYGSLEKMFSETKAVSPYYTLKMPGNITDSNMPNESIKQRKIMHNFIGGIDGEPQRIEAVSEKPRPEDSSILSRLVSYFSRLF